jgi:hypothetical protein
LKAEIGEENIFFGCVHLAAGKPATRQELVFTERSQT